ncbi:MAG: hypothetical protein MJ137_02000 [Clostridia bacterium]|nr:hypothetical protein [Clostridia bacterium]
MNNNINFSWVVPVSASPAESANSRIKSKSCFARARALLKKDGITLSLSLGLMIVLLAFTAGNILCAAVHELIIVLFPGNAALNTEIAFIIIDTAGIVVGALFSLPLSAGLMNMTAGIISDGEADLRELFVAFTGFGRFFSLSAAALPAYFPYTVIFLLNTAMTVLSAAEVDQWIVAVSGVISVMLSVTALIFSGVPLKKSKLFFSGFRMCRGTGSTVKNNKKTLRYGNKTTIVMTFASVWGFILSFLTLGIYYFAYFGPLLCAARAIEASDIIYEKQIRKESVNE